MLILGLVDVPLWLLLIVLATVAFLWHEMRYFNYFKKQGINGITPYPVVGSMRFWGEALKIFPAGDTKLREKYGNTFSEFLGARPGIVVFDDSFISQVMVKDFNNFSSRMTLDTGNEISKAMLSNAEEKQWRHLRPIMSPTFSTGKLRRMIVEINRCASQMASALVERNGEELDFKECSGCFTLDAIASTAFGVRLDSQKDKNNIFVEKAKAAFNLSLRNPALLIMVFLPWMAPVLKLFKMDNIFRKDVIDFFKNITMQAVEARKQEKKQDKIDFLQLMINAQQGEDIRDATDDPVGVNEGGAEKEGKTALTDTELLANGILFFLAGYDTTATALSLLLYNLALNPDCQDRLVEEIDSVLGDKESVSYDMLSKLPYLEQCVHESLRIYPPAVRTSRVADRDVEVNGVHLKKGMLVNIPIYAIHHDEAKWPEPEKFKPERFSAENKASHGPFDYMPFGYGPRNCIAMRLALAEVKVAAVHVLRKVKVTTSAKTDIPMLFKLQGLLAPKNGIWLKPVLREKN